MTFISALKRGLPSAKKPEPTGSPFVPGAAAQFPEHP
jgi:hypothetical protein